MVAEVHASLPVFAANQDPLWVLVSHQPHYVELYFVDARTGTLTIYIKVSGGCKQ